MVPGAFAKNSGRPSDPLAAGVRDSARRQGNADLDLIRLPQAGLTQAVSGEPHGRLFSPARIACWKCYLLSRDGSGHGLCQGPPWSCQQCPYTIYVIQAVIVAPCSQGDCSGHRPECNTAVLATRCGRGPRGAWTNLQASDGFQERSISPSNSQNAFFVV